MSELRDPIRFQFTFENMRADSEGECMLTLRLPAGELAKAARFAIMREIVFEGVCTPTGVNAREPQL